MIGQQCCPCNRAVMLSVSLSMDGVCHRPWMFGCCLCHRPSMLSVIVHRCCLCHRPSTLSVSSSIDVVCDRRPVAFCFCLFSDVVCVIVQQCCLRGLLEIVHRFVCNIVQSILSVYRPSMLSVTLSIDVSV